MEQGAGGAAQVGAAPKIGMKLEKPLATEITENTEEVQPMVTLCAL